MSVGLSADDLAAAAAIESDEEFEERAAEEEEETSLSDANPSQEMIEAQKKRAERNRLKALALKKTRLLSAHPYNNSSSSNKGNHNKKYEGQNGGQKKLVDSGGGFFIEEDENEEGGRGLTSSQSELPAPILPPDQPSCEDCGERFPDSHLLRTFEVVVCDNCRDMSKDGQHELIAKTEAKTTFLLKDHDFDEGEHGPALRFLRRKNPHNRGGEMKLYLRLQVEERAFNVWGSEEALREELESREEKKVAAKSKKYTKKMKELRMAVRSSLYAKDLSNHTHEYGEEHYDEDKDEYSQTCVSCGHINTYEKM